MPATLAQQVDVAISGNGPTGVIGRQSPERGRWRLPEREPRQLWMALHLNGTIESSARNADAPPGIPPGCFSRQPKSNGSLQGANRRWPTAEGPRPGGPGSRPQRPDNRPRRLWNFRAEKDPWLVRKSAWGSSSPRPKLPGHWCGGSSRTQSNGFWILPAATVSFWCATDGPSASTWMAIARERPASGPRGPLSTKETSSSGPAS